VTPNESLERTRGRHGAKLIHRRARRSAQPLEYTVKFSQALVRAEMRSLAALFGVSLTLAVGYALLVRMSAGNYMASTSAVALTFLLSFLIGLIPVAIYGAPIYAWLQHKQFLTWPRVILLGALPGAVAVPFAWSFGATALACGVAVSCLTHGLSKGDGVGAV
jgi:hypothetical protein